VTPSGPLEADIAADVLDPLLRAHADEWYHTRDARGSRDGFPDYTIVVGSWLLLAELKRQGGAPTTAQARWLRALRGSMRLALLVGGVDGALQLGRLVERIKSGAVPPEELGAAGYAVQVLGEISPAGRLAVAGAADDRLAAVHVAAGSPMPRSRRRRDIRKRPRGS
jgi:hypothetical protein